MITLEEELKPLLRDVADFPTPGILFKDITPLLANPFARERVVDAIADHFKNHQIDAVAGVEARGFIFGSLIAQKMAIPFIPIRKAGKLPFKKIREEYALEYGIASIEMHEDAVSKGTKVLLHDDLLATGGTASAAGNMIKRLGAKVAGFSFIANLSFLPGDALLQSRFNVVPHYLISF
jgi:adenine phosphoribosyltransferase